MSKFKDLMAQARQREAEPEHDEAPEEDAPAQASTNGAAPKARTPQRTAPRTSARRSPARPEPEETPVLRRRGRPAGPAGGKRSDPDYEQVSAYLPRQMHREVKLALMQNEVQTGEKKEFSTLMEELLAKWLKGQKVK